MKKRQKAWGGRFKTPTTSLVEEFTASITFDRRLYRHDIEGSIAYCNALLEAVIITEKEAAKIIKGLKEIEEEITNGEFEFRIDEEDIHMNIERRLIEKIGKTGEKLHTGRSRNDQIALDLRLYLKDEIKKIVEDINRLEHEIIRLSKENIDVIMPGYTHLQKAQPILFSHHLLSYYEMLERDKARFLDCFERLDLMPLGAGALSGTGFSIDREKIARRLGFSKVTQNSMDAVSDRDFFIEFCSAGSILMMHLSRFSEDLILWSTEEFNYIILPDSVCTGSSMMPQKKNPDVPELIRGKTGRVYGNLISLLTMMKALPLAYNKDLQEDKEPLFDTVDTIKGSLKIYREILLGLKVNKGIMNKGIDDLSLATDIADYLAGKGVPFRSAHRITGKIVRFCIDNGRDLTKLSYSELQKFSQKFEKDITGYIDPMASINRKLVTGGTAKKRVLERIKEIEKGQ
ncbi:MAG: argininosuccinate lyase [Nitrospirota bacterium]